MSKFIYIVAFICLISTFLSANTGPSIYGVDNDNGQISILEYDVLLNSYNVISNNVSTNGTINLSSAILGDNYYFLSNSSSLISVDLNTGEIENEIEISLASNFSYFVSDECSNRLYGLRINSGNIELRSYNPISGTFQTIGITNSITGVINATSAILDGKFYFLGTDGSTPSSFIVCFDLLTGELTTQLNSAGFTNFHAYENLLYGIIYDSNGNISINSYDPITGTIGQISGVITDFLDNNTTGIIDNDYYLTGISAGGIPLLYFVDIETGLLVTVSNDDRIRLLETKCSCPSIPTLGQWASICLGLLILVCSAVSLLSINVITHPIRS